MRTEKKKTNQTFLKISSNIGIIIFNNSSDQIGCRYPFSSTEKKKKKNGILILNLEEKQKKKKRKEKRGKKNNTFELQEIYLAFLHTGTHQLHLGKDKDLHHEQQNRYHIYQEIPIILFDYHLISC